jgi:hypothetical protein
MKKDDIATHCSILFYLDKILNNIPNPFPLNWTNLQHVISSNAIANQGICLLLLQLECLHFLGFSLLSLHVGVLLNRVIPFHDTRFLALSGGFRNKLEWFAHVQYYSLLPFDKSQGELFASSILCLPRNSIYEVDKGLQAATCTDLIFIRYRPSNWCNSFWLGFYFVFSRN